jgi:uncharacterized membrane protein YgcG
MTRRWATFIITPVAVVFSFIVGMVMPSAHNALQVGKVYSPQGATFNVAYADAAASCAGAVNNTNETNGAGCSGGAGGCCSSAGSGSCSSG